MNSRQRAPLGDRLKTLDQQRGTPVEEEPTLVGEDIGEYDDMPTQPPPRIVQQMQRSNDERLAAEEDARRAAEAPQRHQENISLNTRRDIRCYVMTEAELSSLLVAVTLMNVCSAIAALVVSMALAIVVYEPGLREVAGAAVVGVVILALIGNIIAYYWRNSIVNSIRNGAPNFDARR